MTTRKIVLILLVVVAASTAFCQKIIEGTTATVHTLSSPDSNYVFTFYQKADPEGKKQMYYAVTYKNKPVILESELGVLVENQLFESALAIENDTSRPWGGNLDFKKATRSSKNETWKPLYGERSSKYKNYKPAPFKQLLKKYLYQAN